MSLWTATCQTLLSMAFSRQESWTGLPCSPPGELLDPGIEPASLKPLALVSGFFIIGATDSGDHLWSHFTDEEAEGQEMECSPRSHTWEIIVRPRLTPSQAAPQPAHLPPDPALANPAALNGSHASRYIAPQSKGPKAARHLSSQFCTRWCCPLP